MTMTKRLAAAAVAAVLSACACTAAGCDNRVSFLPDVDLERQVEYEVEACFDGVCETARLIVDGPGTGDVEGALTLWEDADRFELAIGDGDFGGTHAVSFTILDASGTLLAQTAGEIELIRTQPNGAFCPPTCWSGTVEPSPSNG
jgi:hypothetical protein